MSRYSSNNTQSILVSTPQTFSSLVFRRKVYCSQYSNQFTCSAKRVRACLVAQHVIYITFGDHSSTTAVLLLQMCGSLDDCDSDLLSDSDDGFNLSAGVLGCPSNPLCSGNIVQNALEGPSTHDEINDYMLNTDDDNDTGDCSQIECKWNCGSAISEPRSRTTDALATVAPRQDTTLCVHQGNAVGSAHCIDNFFIAYIS